MKERVLFIAWSQDQEVGGGDEVVVISVKGQQYRSLW